MGGLIFLFAPAIVAGVLGAGFGYFLTKPGGVFSPVFLAMMFGGDAFLGVFLICAGLLVLGWVIKL